MSETTLVAEARTKFGKGAARAVRRDHKVPAVLYGHGMAPMHVSLPGHDLMLALKHGGSNALLTLSIDGKEQLALPKAVTRDPIRGFLEHVDLVVVRRGEKVTVDIPVLLTGETGPDVLVTQPVSTVSVVAEATAIPQHIEVDISTLAPGANITAGELELPSGVSLHSDADVIVVSAQGAPTAEALEAELADATADASGDTGPTAEASETPESADTTDGTASTDTGSATAESPAAG